MRLAVIGFCVALAGCALETSPSTGFLPDDAFGNTVQGEDIAVAATEDAAAAFTGPQRGDPASTALAVASLDAMAGQFSTGGRWIGVDQLVKLELLDARDHARAVLGVAPAAESQPVIDGLVAAAKALRRRDQPAALAALSGPVFSLGPGRTLAVLADFPYVRDVNQGAQAAEQNLFPVDDGGVGSMD